MKRRVAVVGACPYPAPQGSQVLLESTALDLARLGHEVHLVVYGHGQGFPTHDIPVHRATAVPGVQFTGPGPSIAKPLMDASLVMAIRRVVREQRIEILHAHNYEALIAALASGFRPIVYHAHTAMSVELPYFFPRIRMARRFGGWLDKTFPHSADAIIAPHKRLRDYLVRMGCRPECIHVIPPAIDVAAFAEPCFDEAMPVIVYTGNLDAYQNLNLLTDAMRRFRRKHPNGRLVVATAAEGTIPGAEMVRSLTFASLRGLLSQDVIVACPRSSWSGYPIKTLNAMAAGRPVVACRSAAHPIEDERTGLVVPDNNPEAFAQALERLYGSIVLRRYLGEAARARMRKAHAPTVIATQIADIYEHILGASGE